MWRNLLAAFLVGLVVAAPATAGLFVWLGGGTYSVRNCTPSDRACLILAASDTKIASFRERLGDQQIHYIAPKLAEAWYLAGPQTRLEIDRMVEDADEDGKLRAALDEQIALARPLPELTLSEAAAALANAALPKAESQDLPASWTVDSFVHEALEQAIVRGEGKQATVFWLKHVDEMWEQAPDGFLLMQRWTAQNDLALPPDGIA
ncbi:hypothetical protein [Martelella mediterranea]|uniref:Uncharacterized protein n=1 Tax=Martelella mediterranea DSM 17316 TaxID=1122214 RepID=A0A1U9Z9Y6_9HYPH|nr:hypothetical protein [Martelella mediterranea]AQZ54529.1 hypothetical protein Mame_05238 [Martelella mediterranea DSM 17316]